MKRNNFMATSRSSIVNVGVMARLSLALCAISGSITLAWVFLGVVGVHAAGVIETPTQATPWAVAIDKSNHVWVAEPGCDAQPRCPSAFPSYIGEYNRTNGALVQNFLEPQGYSSPVFLAIDAKGNIWFTEPTTNAIGKLTPTSPPRWHQWAVPTANANPYDLVFDSNGNIWFTEFSGNQIGFFNTATKIFVETVIPTPGSVPYGITRASNGNIWFVENSQPKIARFTPTTTGAIKIVEQVVNSPTGPTPHLITTDGAGNIWYSEGFSGDIGEYMPKTKTHTNINVSIGLCPSPTPGTTPTACPGTHISGIGVDSLGHVWFDDALSARVGYYDPTTGVVKTLTLANPNAHPHDGLALDGNNNTWFTEEFASPSGMLGEIPAGTL